MNTIRLSILDLKPGFGAIGNNLKNISKKYFNGIKLICTLHVNVKTKIQERRHQTSCIVAVKCKYHKNWKRFFIGGGNISPLAKWRERQQLQICTKSEIQSFLFSILKYTFSANFANIFDRVWVFPLEKKVTENNNWLLVLLKQTKLANIVRNCYYP